MRIQEFIEYHNREYRNYCEVVILPDGDIQYAIPSHQLKLILIEGVSEKDLYNHCGKYVELLDRIPMESSPTHWMCEDTNVICCWYDSCIAPISYTVEQLKVLKELKRSHCISNNFNVEITIEKTLLERREHISEKELYELVGKKSKYSVKLMEEING